jgi:nucleoside 2-deoxyribosyltransferase
MTAPIKIYVAGKMSAHSGYKTHNWRDDFLKEIAKLSGLSFISYDPVNTTKDYTDPEIVFGSDVHMISQVDIVVVYLTDNISVGASQEILIAKYYSKPVIALARPGGKFNQKSKEVAGEVIKNFKHPFVYSTSDIVCANEQEVADALLNLDSMKVKNINIIDIANKKFTQKHSQTNLYKTKVIK